MTNDITAYCKEIGRTCMYLLFTIPNMEIHTRYNCVHSCISVLPCSELLLVLVACIYSRHLLHVCMYMYMSDTPGSSRVAASFSRFLKNIPKPFLTYMYIYIHIRVLFYLVCGAFEFSSLSVSNEDGLAGIQR